LADFIQALQLPKISLIVQGFLASVGLQYALENPDKIERLIVLNTPLSRDVKLPWIMKQWGLPFLGDMATQDPLLVDRTLETGSGFVISDADLAIFRQPYLKTSAAMAEIETGLENFEKPILFVWGMGDPWLSSVTVEKLATKSGVELIPLAEAKHYPQEHWSKEISPQIINFLGRKT